MMIMIRLMMAIAVMMVIISCEADTPTRIDQQDHRPTISRDLTVSIYEGEDVVSEGDAMVIEDDTMVTEDDAMVTEDDGLVTIDGDMFIGDDSITSDIEDIGNENDTVISDGLRVIRISTTESPSWVAWFEIQVIGAYVDEGGDVSNIAADAALSASSSGPGDGVERVVDGDLNTAWNASDLPLAWIELEFPAAIELTRLRLHVAQSPPGRTVHDVLMGPNNAELELAHQFIGQTSNNTWLEYSPGSQTDTSNKLLFNIITRQTHQSCSSCGIWFDWQEEQANKPKLVVEYEQAGEQYTAEYQHDLMGMDNAHAIWIKSGQDHDEAHKHQMLIKRGPRRNGLFRVDASDIPVDAAIVEARLHLHLNNHEGLANADHTSTLTVYECTRDWDWNSVNWTHATRDQLWTSEGGDFGREVREIHAGRDMHDRGFNKASPNGSFDFTPYMQLLQRERNASGSDD
jgi:hypothetical protein